MLVLAGYILAMLAVVVLVRIFAERVNLPEGIILTIVGIAYGLLPGANLHLDPEIVLVFVLPPLLYGAGRRSSLLAIRANWRPIASLSVALVLVTAFTVGALVHAVAPTIPLAAGLVLGAAVAPPDPVAALAVGRRAGMEPRLTALIGGEGLLNDATALTTYEVALGVMAGSVLTFPSAVGTFVIAAVGGLAMGTAIGYIVRWLRPLNHDPLIANAISLGTPFAAYVAGQEAHVSGVLAVVITGLMAGHDAPRESSGASRLQTGAVWQLVEFLLEGLVFLLIGEQLPAVIRGLRGESLSLIFSVAGVTVAAVLLVRPLWLLLTHALPARLGWTFGEKQPPLTGRELTALSWAGTRGVITLAAIFAVPLTAHHGVPFPGRDLLLLSAYMVVLVTIVLQGSTFGPLLRKLGLRANPSEEAQVRNEARIAATEAAAEAMAEMYEEGDLPADITQAMQRALRERADRYRARITMLQASDDDSVSWSPEFEAAVRARHAAIDAQREELVRWRDSGRLSDENLRKLTRELDHEEHTLPGRPAA